MNALHEGFATNMHADDSQKFAIVAMAYIGNTKTFATAPSLGADGLWVRHLSRGVDCVARVTVVTTAETINTWMEDLRADRLDPEMETRLVYSDRDDDVNFTGGLTRKGNKLYTLNGTELRRRPTASTANSAARSIWDRISKTMH